MSELFFKVLDSRFRSYNGGCADWKCGAWQPEIANIKLCERGYHLCRPQDLIHWLGPRICLAEGRGDRIDSDNKVVFAQARRLRWLRQWNERTARLFACECAERVLPLFEEYYPTDNRPRRAIEIARLYADGKATDGERAAARSAARDAARNATWDAAKDAAWAATWAAACPAAVFAEAAAWVAAEAVADFGALEQQATRLMEILGVTA